MLARPFTSVVAASAVAVAAIVFYPAPPSPADAMASAANAWLKSLPKELRENAQRGFEDKERMNWHFVPRQRQGVSLKEMGADQRRLAHALLRSAVSQQGYLKATSVMELESVLFALESRPDRPARHRDPELYWFLVFGTPGGDKPWGWRVEGHHLSLNFTAVGTEIVAFAPAFLGANPAEVRSGRRAGLRVLAAEEDFARELISSLSAEQRAEAKISDQPPRDIILAPGKDASLLTKRPGGISVGQLDPTQRRLFSRLIAAHARTLRGEDGRKQIARMRRAGLEKIQFGWAGSMKPGDAHYYRIVGPTVVIEYDNIQNGANHIHVVWRDPENDFGQDALRAHLRRDHK